MSKTCIQTGATTILVDVGGSVPLVLTGVIQRDTSLNFRKNNCTLVEGEITEQKSYIIVNVTEATPPVGFPVDMNLIGSDIAINKDYVILLLPVNLV